MKPVYVVVLVVLVLAVIYTVGHLIFGATIEKPKYEVLKMADGYEIRRYQALVIAEVEAEAGSAIGGDLSAGFKEVAAYIFGGNESKQKIAMTAPVLDTYEGKEARTVSFVLPSNLDFNKLPKPDDDKLVLRKTDPMVVAVRTVRGSWSQQKLQRELAKLRQLLTKDDVPYSERVSLAYYDPPSSPWFIRKTEILVEVPIGTAADVSDDNIPANASVATFAGGCFWCIEAPYDNMEGVYAAISGYTGGKEEDAEYRRVASGRTDHRESVRVYYDPQKVSYEELLEIFWRQIDPTDSGGQFADRGHQYTTAIYYHDDEQKALAEQTLKDIAASGKFEGEIATEILPAADFYEAEPSHQNFAQKQSEYYKRYKYGSGRGGFIEEKWGS